MICVLTSDRIQVRDFNCVGLFIFPRQKYSTVASSLVVTATTYTTATASSLHLFPIFSFLDCPGGVGRGRRNVQVFGLRQQGRLLRGVRRLGFCGQWRGAHDGGRGSSGRGHGDWPAQIVQGRQRAGA